MDRLPPESQEQLKKMGTERLSVKLGKAGYDEDRLLEMDRAELLDAMAEVTVDHNLSQEASQVPLPKSESGSVASEAGTDPLCLQELELEDQRAEREERRAEREAAERRAEREAEIAERRAAREAEERKAEREAKMEQERARMQLEQAKLAHEMKMIELRAMGDSAGDNDGDDGPTYKRFGETMKHVLPRMPQESAELPQFFETVEKLYLMYAVPDEVKATILIPLLTTQAKSLINRMSIENMGVYDELKKFLLAEYKLTPREYKSRFENAAKHPDETYMLFAARLCNLLTYYLSSRDVADYKTLIELLISDRLKGSLPQGPLNYVLTQEGEGWFTSEKVASLADVFVNNRTAMVGQKPSDGKMARIATTGASEGPSTSHGSHGVHGGNFHSGRGRLGGPHSPSKMSQVKCYTCGGRGHIARDCPSNKGGNRGGVQGGSLGGYRGSHRGNYQGRGAHRGNHQSGRAHVNLCSIVGQPQMRETHDMGIQSDEGGHINLIASNNWEFGDHPIVDAVSTSKDNPTVCIYPLQYVNVTMSGCDCVALEDSGCQIPLVSKRLFSWCCDETVGKVVLHGFGKNHTVQAPLVNVTARIRDDQHDVTDIPLVCAVTDLGAADYDVILPADVVRELQAATVAANVSECTVSTLCDVGTETVEPEAEENSPEDVDRVPVTSIEADSSVLAEEQRQDPTLVTCWAQAQASKGGFVIHKELLYHRDQVEGQAVCQLCVPQGR